MNGMLQRAKPLVAKLYDRSIWRSIQPNPWLDPRLLRAVAPSKPGSSDKPGSSEKKPKSKAKAATKKAAAKTAGKAKKASPKQPKDEEEWMDTILT